MKKALSVLLVLAFVLSICPMALAQEAGVAAKMTEENKRITAYTGYLQDEFDNDTVITHVGVADVNKDTYPELFYVTKEDGESTMHFCYYDEGDVDEYDLDADEMGKNPKNFSLIRRVRNGEHMWSLKFQSKNEDKYNQIMYYTFQREDTTLTMELKYQRLWKGSKTEFYVEDMPTTKAVYYDEVDNFTRRWPQAKSDKKIVSVGVIRKVSNAKKWAYVRKALAQSMATWEIKKANL